MDNLAPGDVKSHDFDTDRSRVSYTRMASPNEIDCEFIVGGDGFHGVSRASSKCGDPEIRADLSVRLARRSFANPAGEP